MKPLIIANWKMNPATLAKAKKLFSAVKKGAGNSKNVKVVICPPFPYIAPLSGIANAQPKSKIIFGAQDCFWQAKGAFTGEVSTAMLKSIKVKYVIIGHSERRHLLNETNEIINKKLLATIGAKLIPILCVGETEYEKKSGKTKHVLKKQIDAGLKDVSKQNSKLILAYEPVWAIGTGKHPTSEYVRSISILLNRELKNIFGKQTNKIPIIYGGSVNSKNGLTYIEKAKMQGLLVGNASLKAKEFIKIVKNV